MDRANLRGLGKAAGSTERPNEQRIYSAVLDPSLTWREIEWLQSLARTPVLLKGILNPEDARRAVETGVAGAGVSPHPGGDPRPGPPPPPPPPPPPRPHPRAPPPP